MRASASATLQGIAAIGLWATLASLTAAVPAIPPFELAFMTFAIATLVGFGYAAVTGAPLAMMTRVPAASWLLGVYGLLGYHACYFYAFRNAPAVEANLVNYLWPLLIVMFSGLLPQRFGGRRLRWGQIAGALMGFGGTALIVAGTDQHLAFSGSSSGYAAALAAAFIWSSYSVASRVFSAVPSVAVTGSCALTACGALACHLAFETAVWPAGMVQGMSILAQGLGPVGLAFYLWDTAMKRGDIRLLGVLSYATPLLSTLLLVLLGLGRAGTLLWLAAGLITAGALLASYERGKSD